MGWMQDETGLEKCAANFVPLTPLSHLNRAKQLFPNHEAVVYGTFRKTYAEYHARVSRLASALAKAGIKAGDVVATLIPNIPAQAEASFGIPACGAVLNTINTRLEDDTVGYIFDHGAAKAVIVDSQFMPLARAASPMRSAGSIPSTRAPASTSRAPSSSPRPTCRYREARTYASLPAYRSPR